MPCDKATFQELVHEYNNRVQASPCANMEIIRDGRTIGLEDCRLTMGVLVMCETAKNPVFNPASSSEPTLIDLLEVFWLCQERNIGKAVWLVDDRDSLNKTIMKYAGSLSRKYIVAVCSEMLAWLSDILEALPKAEGGDGAGSARRGDWYMDVIDQIAHEYGWSQEYIMWDLSWVKNVRLRESMYARMSGKQIVDGMDNELQKLIKIAKGD